MAIDFHLVSAARRAHRLRTERTYVMGREETVDIVLQDALASRRHAELKWSPDGYWFVVDLASRNGVYINGARIGAPTQLADGSQLQIGGQVYRLYALPPGGDPASIGNQAPQISNQETLGPGVNMADLATQGATFTGVVSSGLLELLSFFHTTVKTGRLDLIGSAGMGSVWIKAGAPVHAQFGNDLGFDALIELTRTPPPRFAFHGEAAPAGDYTLTGNANAILMDVARAVDESAR